ncbi:MAG: hypothetical protein ACI8Z5_002547, partial [Lentimonas sp.]
NANPGNANVLIGIFLGIAADGDVSVPRSFAHALSA